MSFASTNGAPWLSFTLPEWLQNADALPKTEQDSAARESWMASWRALVEKELKQLGTTT